MLHWLKYVTGVLIFLSCQSHPKRHDRVIVIGQLIDSLYQVTIFNGAIVIAEGDSIIFSKGYGYADFNDSVLFTPTTLSDGGSLAKTFTAEALWGFEKVCLLEKHRNLHPEKV